MQPLYLDTWRRLVQDRPIAVVDLETTDADADTCGVCELAVVAYGPEQVAAAADAFAHLAAAPRRPTGRELAERLLAANNPDAARALFDELMTLDGAEPLAVMPMPEPWWQHTQRVNPGVPIHPGATAIHGITDADVAGLAGVESVAETLRGVAATHTLVTFNGRRFDLRILQRLIGLQPACAVDVMGLWRDALTRPVPAWNSDAERAAGDRRPRLIGEPLLRCGGVGSSSTGGAKVYKESLEGSHYALLGRAVSDAHQALTDVHATARVLFALLALWGTDGGDPAALEARANWALSSVQDTADGPVFAVGKYKGHLVRDVRRADPSYVGWALASDFDDDDKARIVAAVGSEEADRLVAAQQRKGGGGRGRKPRAAA